MEEYENVHKREEETNETEPKSDPGNYFPEPENESPEENNDIDVTTELTVQNEAETYLESEENLLLASSNVNPEVLPDIGTDRNLVSGENVQVNKDYVEDDPNRATDTENREINQPPISANPSLARRTSWGGCCGLFQLLRLSND